MIDDRSDVNQVVRHFGGVRLPRAVRRRVSQGDGVEIFKHLMNAYQFVIELVVRRRTREKRVAVRYEKIEYAHDAMSESEQIQTGDQLGFAGDEKLDDADQGRPETLPVIGQANATALLIAEESMYDAETSSVQVAREILRQMGDERLNHEIENSRGERLVERLRGRRRAMAHVSALERHLEGDVGIVNERIGVLILDYAR